MKSSSAELDTRSDRGWPTKLPRRITEHRRRHLSNHKNNIRFLKQCRVVCIFIIRKKKKKNKTSTRLLHVTFFFFLKQDCLSWMYRRTTTGKKKKINCSLNKKYQKGRCFMKEKPLGQQTSPCRPPTLPHAT